MAKDNIEFKSLISQDLNFPSSINNSIDCKSQISNDLNFESPIGIETIGVIYSNGIVTNSIFGEVAVFDFDVVANFSGDVVFTVDWGAQIGETEINATLVNGVPQSLDTSIEIPEGVDTDQTIQVTDSLGGSYSVGYTVESRVDADAQAFIDAAVITDGTQQNAINDLVIGLKADSIWTKFKAIYPFVGGTASQHKFNLKDPRDLDVAFRLGFVGGIIHSSTGAKPNATNAFAQSFLNPLNDLSTNSMHVSYYSRDNINTGAGQWDIGVFTASNALALSAQYNTGSFVNRLLSRNSGISGASDLANTANADARGLVDSSKTSNGTNTFKTHKNGVVQDTLDGVGTNPNDQIFLFGINNLGADAFRTNRECAFASIGEGLTDTDSANLYTRVQAFQTALSRQV